MGVPVETPPFTMTSFQSAHGQVAVWCKYSSSETDDRIASSTIVLLDTELHFALDQGRLLKVKGHCDDGSVHCLRPIKVCLWCV